MTFAKKTELDGRKVRKVLFGKAQKTLSVDCTLRIENGKGKFRKFSRQKRGIEIADTETQK